MPLPAGLGAAPGVDFSPGPLAPRAAACSPSARARILDQAVAGPRVGRDAVPDRVFDQRLQHRFGTCASQCFGRDVDVGPAAVAEPRLLDFKVPSQDVEFALSGTSCVMEV